MSPQNLEDIEEYMLMRASHITPLHNVGFLQRWIRDCFAELRAREASIVQNPVER